MSFQPIGLDVIAPSGHGNNSMLAYTTGDDLADVIGANYFDGGILSGMGAKVGDVILCFCANGSIFHSIVVLSDSPSNVELSSGLLIPAV